MSELRKLMALPAADRQLLLRAAAVVGVIRVGLPLLRFRRLRRLLLRLPPRGGRSVGSDAASPERVAWAVTLASERLLGREATCLVRAMATQLLLAREGHRTRLHVGVAREGARGLQAHAWVKSGARVVIGGSASDVARYTPLAVMDPEVP